MNSTDLPNSTRPSTPRTAKRPPASPAPSMARLVTTEDIARRAYEIFVARGGEHGRHDEDWAQAERELNGGPAPARRPRAVRAQKPSES